MMYWAIIFVSKHKFWIFLRLNFERTNDKNVVKKRHGNGGRNTPRKKNINKGKQFFLMRWVVFFIMNFRTSSSSCHAPRDLLKSRAAVVLIKAHHKNNVGRARYFVWSCTQEKLFPWFRFQHSTGGREFILFFSLHFSGCWLAYLLILSHSWKQL